MLGGFCDFGVFFWRFGRKRFSREFVPEMIFVKVEKLAKNGQKGQNSQPLSPHRITIGRDMGWGAIGEVYTPSPF